MIPIYRCSIKFENGRLSDSQGLIKEEIDIDQEHWQILKTHNFITVPRPPDEIEFISTDYRELSRIFNAIRLVCGLYESGYESVLQWIMRGMNNANTVVKVSPECGESFQDTLL